MSLILLFVFLVGCYDFCKLSSPRVYLNFVHAAKDYVFHLSLANAIIIYQIEERHVIENLIIKNFSFYIFVSLFN